jgi:hypothetical protein
MIDIPRQIYYKRNSLLDEGITTNQGILGKIETIAEE